MDRLPVRNAIKDRIRDHIADARAGYLAPLGIKVVDSPEFRQVERLSDVLPQVCCRYLGSSNEYDNGTESLEGIHEVEVMCFRLLEPADEMNTDIVELGDMVSTLFSQGRFVAPFKAGWTREDTMIKHCFPSSFRVEESMVLDDGQEIEAVSIILQVHMSQY